MLRKIKATYLYGAENSDKWLNLFAKVGDEQQVEKRSSKFMNLSRKKNIFMMGEDGQDSCQKMQMLLNIEKNVLLRNKISYVVFMSFTKSKS